MIEEVMILVWRLITGEGQWLYDNMDDALADVVGLDASEYHLEPLEMDRQEFLSLPVE